MTSYSKNMAELQKTLYCFVKKVHSQHSYLFLHPNQHLPLTDIIFNLLRRVHCQHSYRFLHPFQGLPLTAGKCCFLSWHCGCKHLYTLRSTSLGTAWQHSLAAQPGSTAWQLSLAALCFYTASWPALRHCKMKAVHIEAINGVLVPWACRTLCTIS